MKTVRTVVLIGVLTGLGALPVIGQVHKRAGKYPSHQVLPGRLAGDHVVESARALGPPALGNRAAVSRAQGRTRARSLRGSFVAGMATPRRADRARVWLQAEPPSSRRPIADAAHRAGNHHRNSHRAFLGYASALLGMLKLKKSFLRI